MSYDDTQCPCGGRKPRRTMLCDECLSEMKDHPSMAVYRNLKATMAERHHACVVLLALAKGRNSAKPTAAAKELQP